MIIEKKIRLSSDIMVATDSALKRKCLTLEIKQSVHRCFKSIWEVNGPNLGRMPVYRMVGEIFTVS
jgi:hypothetical protein